MVLLEFHNYETKILGVFIILSNPSLSIYLYRYIFYILYISILLERYPKRYSRSEIDR